MCVGMCVTVHTWRPEDKPAELFCPLSTSLWVSVRRLVGRVLYSFQYLKCRLVLHPKWDRLRSGPE